MPYFKSNASVMYIMTIQRIISIDFSKFKCNAKINWISIYLLQKPATSRSFMAQQQNKRQQQQRADFDMFRTKSQLIDRARELAGDDTDNDEQNYAEIEENALNEDDTDFDYNEDEAEEEDVYEAEEEADGVSPRNAGATINDRLALARKNPKKNRSVC